MAEECDERGIPIRLARSGRDPCYVFNRDERLYIRYSKDSVEPEGGQPSALRALKVEEQSCNRSLFCDQPEDTLYNIDGPPHFADWGVLVLITSDLGKIRLVHAEDGNKTLFFEVVHTPNERMYPHSDICLLKDFNRVNKFRPKNLKAELKEALLGIMTVHKNPG